MTEQSNIIQDVSKTAEEASQQLQELGSQEIWGFEIGEVMGLIGLIILGYAIGKIAAITLRRVEKHTEEKRKLVSLTVSAIAGPAGMFGLLWGVKAGVMFLDLDPEISEIAQTIISMLIVITIGFVFFNLVMVPYTMYQRWAEAQDSKLVGMVGPLIRTSLRVAVVVLTLVQVAQVISDQPITSIIASLGIGGLAFALAAQDSLKHLFGSIVIFADRPFEVGDRLLIDGHDGPVEQVGFRSTKIRTLEGHLVTVPNGELVNKNIQNIGKRPHIRRIMNVTITYDTPPAKIEKAIAILKELLDNHEGMHEDFPPRVYFNDMNADSLNIIVIYWYHPPNYWDFMEFTQNFHLELMRRFEKEGIEFAFPTQTLYLAGDENRPLKVGIEEAGAKAKSHTRTSGKSSSAKAKPAKKS